VDRNAIGYVRVSSRDQDDQTFSIEAQESMIETYCSRRDYVFHGCFLDTGISGDLASQPALAELVDYCTLPGSKIMAVVVSDLSRIARSADKLLRVIDTLKAHDIRLVCARDK